MARGWRREPFPDWTPPPRWRGTPFAIRRTFFEQHARHCNERVVCPACGYPILLERGGFNYCSLCCWEDDGHDDPYARDVNGGPNGNMTLDRARNNFEMTCCIWSFEERDDFTPYNQARLFDPEPMASRRRLRELYDQLMVLVESDAIDAQWAKIDSQWKVDLAINRTIDDRFGA